MASLREVLEGIRDAAQDLASLDVVTLTGQIGIEKRSGDAEAMSLQELYKAIQKKAFVDAEMKVVAFTHVDLDRDVLQFVSDAIGDDGQHMLDAHNASVQTSLQSRQAFIKMVRELVGLSAGS